MLDYLYRKLQKVNDALLDSIDLDADDLQKLNHQKQQILLDIEEAKQC